MQLGRPRSFGIELPSPGKSCFEGASAPGVGAGVPNGRRIAGPGAAAGKRTEGPAGMLPGVLSLGVLEKAHNPAVFRMTRGWR